MKVLRKFTNFFIYIFLVEFIMFVTLVLPNLKISNKIRGRMLKPFFKKCGYNIQIAKGVRFIQIRKIELGNDVYIAHDVWINGTGGLFIGNGVIISPKVVIATTKHRYMNGAVSNLKSEISPIHIDDGTWVTSNCVITKGVHIGRGCIIGACSSVTKDIPNYTFAGGVPAKPIKKLIK